MARENINIEDYSLNENLTDKSKRMKKPPSTVTSRLYNPAIKNIDEVDNIVLTLPAWCPLRKENNKY